MKSSNKVHAYPLEFLVLMNCLFPTYQTDILKGLFYIINVLTFAPSDIYRLYHFYLNSRLKI